MAAGRLLLPSWMPALDGDGVPIPNAKVFFYVNLTTTLAPVYADEALTTPLANPVEANASGRFPAVWADGDALYSASVEAPYGPAGVPFTYDNLSASLGADILIAGAAETAADAAEQALAEIIEIAANAPEAPSIVNKANVDGGNLTPAQATSFRQAITATGYSGEGVNATPFRAALGLSYASKAAAEAGTDNSSTVTPLRAREGARVLVQWINMAEPQFAGGVKANGIDDDGPAVRAAMAYAKTFSGNLYGGGGVQVVAPRGIIKISTPDATFSDTAIDITGMHNVSVNGGGDGVTTFKTTGNFAFMKGRDVLANPLYRFGLRDAAVEGPGRANVNAHGIVLGPNNDCIFSDLRLWAVRTGAAFANSFHTEWRFIKMNGQGGLSNYDGFHYLDGDISVVENAAVITGGHIFGCERYGFRGESVTGSFVRGLEVLGCGLVGVYIGDSPAGKDLKWFSWEGGAIDTCPDLLAVRKGSSSVAEKLHFTGLWMGYASEGSPGAGVGAEFVGISDSSLYAANITNTTYAVSLSGCNRMSISIDSMDDYDREVVGATGLLVQDTLRSSLRVGSAKKATGSPSTQAVIETGTSNHNLYTGVYDGAVTTVGAQSVKTGALVY